MKKTEVEIVIDHGAHSRLPRVVVFCKMADGTTSTDVVLNRNDNEAFCAAMSIWRVFTMNNANVIVKFGK